MGTRSLVRFFRKGSKLPLVVFYQQYDGYPSSVGLQLANFLKKITLVNGISFTESRKIANGIGCLAAQFCKEFKSDAGGFYITDIDSEDEEWNYNVHVSCDDIEIFVTGGMWDNKHMTIDKFIDFCEKDGECEKDDETESEDDSETEPEEDD
jgi:hypothetical protein